jgi:uncharacterized membrane protein
VDRVIPLLLFPVAVVCFLAAAATDAMYVSSEYLMWLHFSEWLIAAGIAFGVLAGIALIVHRLRNRAMAPWGAAHGWLLCVALVAELVNALVHTADGWTAVVPAGMTLSIVGAIVALASVAALWRSPLAWAAAERTV